MLQPLQRAWLFTRLVLYAFKTYATSVRRSLVAKAVSVTSRRQTLSPESARPQNIVVVGAAFAGHHAARLIARLLPPNSSFRVVVIEPNSHFNFTWVLPRFCVVSDHEHKAFIPYGPHLSSAPEGSIQWIRDRVLSVGKTSVRLRDREEELPYDFLIMATGAEVAEGLPSRVGAEDKKQGMELLKAVQSRIQAAANIVVAGGGASGVELATDAKYVYPDKTVVLVHSRKAVMNRFGPGLQTEALEGLQKLGVNVILEEKVTSQDPEKKIVTLTSGRTVECDCFINCTGQRPASGAIADLAPTAISSSGHIKVKSTLQIADDSLPNIYACGDVADTHTPNPNSRSATRQAETVADNILLAVRGKQPRYRYKMQWGDGVIKLTLGLDRSVLHFWDGQGELMFRSKETDPALMCDGAWSALGAKPFEDLDWDQKRKAQESGGGNSMHGSKTSPAIEMIMGSVDGKALKASQVYSQSTTVYKVE